MSHPGSRRASGAIGAGDIDAAVEALKIHISHTTDVLIEHAT